MQEYLWPKYLYHISDNLTPIPTIQPFLSRLNTLYDK